VRFLILKHLQNYPIIVLKKGANMVLQWKDIYSIGIEEFDIQHKRLFAIYNDLYDAQQKGIASAMLDEKLQEMYDYTKYHFTQEEKLLESAGYPKLEEHIKEHRYYEKHIEDLIKSSEKGKIMVTIKTIDYLKDWIITHILGSDKEYTAFLTKTK